MAHIHDIEIIQRGESGHWHCIITEILDNNLQVEQKKHLKHGSGSYLCVVDTSMCDIPIRYPGATRGHIQLDGDSRIVGFGFYDNFLGPKDGNRLQPIYKKSVLRELNRLIGAKVTYIK